ncbi:hypothetical protein HMPREF0551_2576 [Lautropia mirabilis ATCC 51599]|uniref:Uncharacterized protein n=1 Tax=Lautropia mirabilis ATCC 51599 TaxID=887898 RepID=E7S124_9BURK|nr:hypothetical protein HMPREF0551_2576 [Lautropia mirabilis ATCC 51599]
MSSSVQANVWLGNGETGEGRKWAPSRGPRARPGFFGHLPGICPDRPPNVHENTVCGVTSAVDGGGPPKYNRMRKTTMPVCAAPRTSGRQARHAAYRRPPRRDRGKGSGQARNQSSRTPWCRATTPAVMLK